MDWQKFLTRTDKSFVLVYPTSLIRHNPNIPLYFHIYNATYLKAKLLFIM